MREAAYRKTDARYRWEDRQTGMIQMTEQRMRVPKWMEDAGSSFTQAIDLHVSNYGVSR